MSTATIRSRPLAARVGPIRPGGAGRAGTGQQRRPDPVLGQRPRGRGPAPTPTSRCGRRGESTASWPSPSGWPTSAATSASPSDPSADLSGQRVPPSSGRCGTPGSSSRASALGMKLYLGFYLANIENPATPLADWFDDAGWNPAGAAPGRRVGGRGPAARLRRARARPGAVPPGGQRRPPPPGGSATPGTPGHRRRDPPDGHRPGPAADDDHPPGLPRGRAPGLRARCSPAAGRSWSSRRFTDTDLGRIAHVEFWDGMTSVDGYRAVRFSDAFSLQGTQSDRRHLGHGQPVQRQPAQRHVLPAASRTGPTRRPGSSSRRSSGSTPGKTTSSGPGPRRRWPTSCSPSARGPPAASS